MLLRHGGCPEDIIFQLLLRVRHVHHKEGHQEHSLIPGLQVPEDVLCLARIGGDIGGDDIHVEPLTRRPLLGVDLHAVQVGDLALDRLDRLVLVHAPNMEAHKNGAVRIQKVGKHTVIQLRGRDLQETHRPIFTSHAEAPCLPETEGGRRDKILDRQAGRGKPVPFKGKPLPVRVEDAMQHRQPFLPVQGFCQRAHCLEIAQRIQGDTGEPRPGLLDVLRFDGKHQELRLDHAVVAVFELPPEHICIKGTYPVKAVPLGVDLNAFAEIRLVYLPAHKGKLHANRSVVGVIHIAQDFKDGRLVVLLGELVIHILKFDAPAPACIA